MHRYGFFLLPLLVLLMGASPAAAQIIEAESADGERVLMSELLRRAEHKIMIRAVSRTGDARTEWALTFRSTDAQREVHITADGEAIEPLRVATDTEAPGGMTTVFLSGEAFHEIAHASEVAITIGDKSLTLPVEIHDDMQRILRRSGG